MSGKVKGKHGGARCRSGRQIPPEKKLTPTGITIPVGEWELFLKLVPSREIRQQLFLKWVRDYIAASADDKPIAPQVGRSVWVNPQADAQNSQKQSRSV